MYKIGILWNYINAKLAPLDHSQYKLP